MASGDKRNQCSVGSSCIALLVKGLCYELDVGEKPTKGLEMNENYPSQDTFSEMFLKKTLEMKIASFTFHCINGCSSLNF